MVLVAVLVVGAGIAVAVWKLWPGGQDSAADSTSTSTSTPTSSATCWNPDITGDCPQFAGRDAAMYVFPPKDETDRSTCTQVPVAEFEEGIMPKGAVDIYKCKFEDLQTGAVIMQWPSIEEATGAWMYLPESPGFPWYVFDERWTVDGQELGDDLIGPDVGSGNEFHALCYDDLPFCVWMLGETGKGGTGEEGDWTLVWDKFDPLNAQEVEALNAFLDDNPSMAPEPTVATAAAEGREVTELSNVERTFSGQLAKGYCFDVFPDITDLSTPVVAETIPCTDPHLGQVIGFVDITSNTTRSNLSYQTDYWEWCQNLATAENVPEELQERMEYYYPDTPEMEAGVRVAMCFVRISSPWTGSVLDGTAAGY